MLPQIDSVPLARINSGICGYESEDKKTKCHLKAAGELGLLKAVHNGSQLESALL